MRSAPAQDQRRRRRCSESAWLIDALKVASLLWTKPTRWVPSDVPPAAVAAESTDSKPLPVAFTARTLNA